MRIIIVRLLKKQKMQTFLHPCRMANLSGYVSQVERVEQPALSGLLIQASGPLHYWPAEVSTVKGFLQCNAITNGHCSLCLSRHPAHCSGLQM